MKNKTGNKFMDNLFKMVNKHRAERIRKAGKHKCIAVSAGCVQRVTDRSCKKALKRPVRLHTFYECKICGRDMEKPKK